MEPTRHEIARRLPACALASVAFALAGPARGETLLRFDATANLGTSQTVPSLGPSDEHFLDLRPSLTVQVGTPRLVWRASYLFSGSLRVGDQGSATYSNSLDLGLAAEPNLRTSFSLTGGIVQGGASFRLSQPRAEDGQPTLRAPGAPELIVGTASQTFSWEASPLVRFGQSADAAWTVRQDALDQGAWQNAQPAIDDGNGAFGFTLRLDRAFSADAAGLSASARYAVLQPLLPTVEGSPVDVEQQRSFWQILQATWSRDLTSRWSAHLAVGAERLQILGGDDAASIHPTGTLTANYDGGAFGGSVSYTHGIVPSLETGTIGESDQVVVSGGFPVRIPRVEDSALGASVGYLYSRPGPGGTLVLGDSQVLSGDLGLTVVFSEELQAVARYSLSYQFGRGDPSTIHVLLVGLTARYGDVEPLPPLPGRGERVDGADGTEFGPRDRGP